MSDNGRVRVVEKSFEDPAAERDAPYSEPSPSSSAIACAGL
jgi:hypothetical protein